MSWKNIRLIFLREVRDQLRDRRTLFMITILPMLLYPMLGLGMVEMMLTFSEQRRTVVVLNAKELPTEPAFLNNEGIDPRWLGAGTDGTPMAVVSDLPRNDNTVATQRRRNRSREEILKQAHQLAERVLSRESNGSDGETASEDLSSAFSEADIEVLVLVPDGYAQTVQAVRDRATQANTMGSVDDEASQLIVVRNSADDKSVVAFSIVKTALQSWEASLRESIFADVALPPSLQYPAHLKWVEVARGEQVSANVWSKMFPAMLVVMALTGAFYPAIDLGAGEKERGTMETLLISPARRVELVLGKFCTILLFSICSALMNLASIAITGRQMASSMGAGLDQSASLEFPPVSALMWVLILLLPLAALFSALCLALATFARSTKEGQYYLTPLLMVIMGLTMFCLSPTVEIAPLYSVLPIVNVALLLKGLLLTSGQTSLLAYAIPVLVSSFGYSLLAIWWAIDLFNNESVLFRESEKFDLRVWLRQLTRPSDAVPAFPEAVFCFIGILMLQWVSMTFLQPDLNLPPKQLHQKMLQLLCVQQLVTIACPAVFMGLILTTSPRATFRLRMPKATTLLLAVSMAALVHPLSIELNQFLMEQGVFPELPEAIGRVQALMASDAQPFWVLVTAFALVPAICEELAFRGFILSGLARGGRLGIAIVMSSMMFGIMHMIPQQAFNASLVGLIIGLLAVHSRSLFPAIVFHFTNNTLAIVYSRGILEAEDGFLFRHEGDVLRYNLPVLLVCAGVLAVITVRMVQDLLREQEAKRRGELQPYVDPNALEAEPSTSAVAAAPGHPVTGSDSPGDS